MTPDAIDTIYQRFKRSAIIQTIAPDDEMWLAGPDWYFLVGEGAVLAILRALAMGSLQNVETILDLPCWARPGSPSSVCRLPRSELQVLRPQPSRPRFLLEDVWRSRRLFSA
jgi:hypothetical protein